MSIRTKVLAPLIILLVIYVGVFLNALNYFSNSKKSVDREIQRISQINSIAMQIAVLRQQSRNNLLFYRILKDTVYLDTINHIQDDVNTLLIDLRPLVTTEQGKQMLTDFENGVTQVRKDRTILIEAVRTNSADLDRLFQTWYLRSENNYASLLDFINYHHQQSVEAYGFYEDLLGRIYMFKLLFTIAMVIYIITLYLHLRRTVTNPLSVLSDFAHNIAKGNFGVKYRFDSDDEVGTLYKNLNAMSNKLEKQHIALIKSVRSKEKEIEKLKEFEAQKDNFISIASHELKTPVTSVKLLNQLLLKNWQGKKPEEVRSHLKRMDGEINKLVGLITSLLEVAKMQLEKIPFSFVDFDLDKTLKERVYLAQKGNRRYKFVTTGKPKTVVYGDRDRIAQVIDNLLSNAIKYSPEGKKITVTLTRKNKSATVSVKDEGIGVKKALQKKIFRRFYRVNDTGKNTVSGFGIGLYISSEIIKKHKGRMWVESTEGKGSVFSFSIPVKKPQG